MTWIFLYRAHASIGQIKKESETQNGRSTNTIDTMLTWEHQTKSVSWLQCRYVIRVAVDLLSRDKKGTQLVHTWCRDYKHSLASDVDWTMTAIGQKGSSSAVRTFVKWPFMDCHGSCQWCMCFPDKIRSWHCALHGVLGGFQTSKPKVCTSYGMMNDAPRPPDFSPVAFRLLQNLDSVADSVATFGGGKGSARSGNKLNLEQMNLAHWLPLIWDWTRDWPPPQIWFKPEPEPTHMQCHPHPIPRDSTTDVHNYRQGMSCLVFVLIYTLVCKSKLMPGCLTWWVLEATVSCDLQARLLDVGSMVCILYGIHPCQQRSMATQFIRPVDPLGAGVS